MEILSDEERQFTKDTADKYIAEEKLVRNKYFHSRNGFVLSLVLIVFYFKNFQERNTALVVLLLAFSFFMLLVALRYNNLWKIAQRDVWAWATPFEEQMRQFNKWLREQENKKH